MKIDSIHYAQKLEKTLGLLTHVTQESSLHDGVVLMSLKDIQDYLDLVQSAISHLKGKNVDVNLLNQIIAESEATKAKLVKLYEPRLKLFGDIRENFIKIVNNLNEVDKYRGRAGKEEFVVALVGLISVLLKSQDIDLLPSEKDKESLLKSSEALNKIDFKNLTEPQVFDFLKLKTQINKIADRYHYHYLEISELSKMQPSLIQGADNSFNSLAENILEENSGATKTLKKINKVTPSSKKETT